MEAKKTPNPHAQALGQLGGRVKVPKGFSSDRAKASEAGRRSAEVRAEKKKKLLEEQKRLC